MKNTVLPAAMLAFTVLMTSCDEGGRCLEGEGDVETRSLDISRFEGVSVNGSIQEAGSSAWR